MLKRILLKMQEKIRNYEYVMTYHARKEMNDDSLSVYDIENGLLTGKIVERQKDRITEEWKYRIKGKTVRNEPIEIIAKFGMTGKLVIVTVYLC